MKIAVFTNVLIIFLSILGFVLDIVLDNRNPKQYIENNYYSISISNHSCKSCGELLDIEWEIDKLPDNLKEYKGCCLACIKKITQYSVDVISKMVGDTHSNISKANSIIQKLSTDTK